MTATCESCGAPVIRREDGRVLDAEPHRLGVQDPIGGTVAPTRIARAFHGTGPLVGYLTHSCPEAAQDALFDVPTAAYQAGRGAR